MRISMSARIACDSLIRSRCRAGGLRFSALVLTCLLGFPGLLAIAQSPAPAAGSRQPASSGQPTVSDETRRAAERGDAKAQYAVAWSEFEAAGAASSRAANQWGPYRPELKPLSAAELEAARAKWAAVPEAEARQAGLAGDRGAQWFVSKLDNSRVSERFAKAFELLKQAAAQSYPPAEYDVGRIYLHLAPYAVGDRDEKQGLKWLRQAMDHGYEPAQHRWADLLLEGGILPPDVPRAIDLLRLAVEQGCARAQLELAQQYTCGNGEARSADETPVALLTKAANAGMADAQFALGERCRMGVGVEKNQARALFWYRVAATRGAREAPARRQKLEGELSQDEIQQANRWVADFESEAKKASTQGQSNPRSTDGMVR